MKGIVSGLHMDPLGSDAPLLLLPGTLCDERVFTPLLDALQVQPFTICNIGAESSVTAAAKRILQDAPPRFLLLGFSLGGIVALQVARAAGDRLLGLALLSATARPAPARAWEERRRVVAYAKQIGITRFTREVLWPSYTGDIARSRTDLQDLILDMAVTKGLGVFEQQVEMSLARPEQRDFLKRCAVPSLILGGEDDWLCPPFLQNEMARALPRASLAILPQAGHFALLEAPHQVADHVNTWLRAVAESRNGHDLALHRNEAT